MRLATWQSQLYMIYYCRSEAVPCSKMYTASLAGSDTLGGMTLADMLRELWYTLVQAPGYKYCDNPSESNWRWPLSGK